MGHKPKLVQDAYAAQRKIFRLAHGKSAWQLQHQIRTGLQRRFCAHGGGKQGGHAALGKTAAHDAHNSRVGQLFPNQRKLPRVPPVEGVVFANDAYGRPHNPP